MLLSSEFQTSSTMAWQGQKDVEPFKMLRTWIGTSSRLYIFGLVIQDHIESIGKPILLKGDEVLLNDLFAQVLSDIAPKSSTTFSIQICPKPTFQLSPTEISYSEPPSSSALSVGDMP